MILPASDARPFEIDVPDGWDTDADPPPPRRLALFAPAPPGEFRSNVNVIAAPLDPLTRDEYVTLSRLQAKQLAGSPRLAVDEPAPGADNHVFEYESLRAASVPLRFRQRVVFAGDTVYVVTATAPPMAFERLRPVILAVLDSFRVGARPSAEAATRER